MMAKIRKGDRVMVLSGKDKGAEGVVVSVDPRAERAIVEGVNIARKSQRPVDEINQGGIIDINMPIGLSKLAVVSPSDGKPTRVGFRVEDDGTKVRICRRTGAEIK
ncbi:MAG: 50S ribosomal protein L24 [Actinomycetota bacterium]